MVESSICDVDTDILMNADSLGITLISGKKSIDALKNISISAKKGYITGFVGPDGAGKTTLMRLSAGLLVPTEGTMRVLGFDVTKNIDEIRSRIGYMPQQFGLYEDLSILENLNLFANIHNVPIIDRKERFELLLNLTGLGPFINRRAGQLSGGMKQKLGVACCLVKSPELLILDEPTVGVDPVSRRDLWKILKWMIKEEGMGILLSTSYLDEAERCDYVVMLHKGRILEEGPPEHFRNLVSNRVFMIEPSDNLEPRDVQSIISHNENVVDATIRSGQIRTVFKNEIKAKTSFLESEYIKEIEKVKPVFEDSFIDILSKENQHQTFSQIDRTKDLKNQIKTESDVVVSVDNLIKNFGSFTAVKNISFKVSKGEIFGLLGANGAGKTTTFRMLCGLLPASGGEIHVAGNNLRNSPSESRRKLGYMAQKFSLYKQITVLQNLKFFGKAYGLKGEKLNQRVNWALDEFDLNERKAMEAGKLPGGFKQRLAMAASMLHEPDILFLDEPTSGADPLARREFWERINSFSRIGVTVIVTTHFMEEAEYCDKMIIMSQGSTLAKGTPSEIRSMVTSEKNRKPTIEDAFIELTEGNREKNKEGIYND